MKTSALAPLLLAAAACSRRPAPGRRPGPVERSRPPTRGVLIPGGVLAGDVDATALETNPGQLGLLETASTALVANAWPDGTTREGRGGGLFYATPLFLRGLSPRGGPAVAAPEPDRSQPTDYGKLSIAGGLRLGRSLGFGAVWERLFALALRRHRQPGPGSELAAVLAPGRRRHRARSAAPAGRAERAPAAARDRRRDRRCAPFGTPRLELAGGLRLLQGGDATTATPPALVPHGRALGGGRCAA